MRTGPLTPTWLPPRLRLGPERRARLIDVACGRGVADLVVDDGVILNVYTGELTAGSIGIVEGRIAWVGEALTGAEERIDAAGATVVPGLIEPHGHSDLLYTPSELVRTIAVQGTTTVALELHSFVSALDEERLLELDAGMETATTKVLWRLRPTFDRLERVDADALGSSGRMLGRLGKLAALGEVLAWPRLLDGDAALRELVESAIARGLQIESHAPGASPRTLARLAAAGFTSEHEAISAEEIVQRLRLGFHAMVRGSSVRRDAAAIAGPLLDAGVPLDRVMLTTDGLVARDLVEGSLDALLRELVAAGIPPLAALRMATLAPATYLKLDAHVGAVAPGRCADLVLLPALDRFEPELVIADGRVVLPEAASGGSVEWSGWPSAGLALAALSGKRIEQTCLAGPALRLEGIVTRRSERSSGDAFAALVSREADWITGFTVAGPLFDAFASTYTGRGDVLLLGQDADALAAAYRRTVELGGGIVTPRVSLALPILGFMSPERIEALARATGAIASDLGWGAQEPPLEYLSLFLTLGAIPELRLTPHGILDAKTREIVRPVEALG